MIDEIRALDIDSVSQGVMVYYSSGFRERAEEVGPMLADAVDFFADSLEVSLDFRLALLDTSEWKRLRHYPYGIPYVGGGNGTPYVAVLPADGEGVAFESVVALEETLSPVLRERLRATGLTWDEATRTMVDLIGFHEIGHAYSDAYGIGWPARWFREFMASYLAYAYMHATQPQMAEVWDLMGEAIVQGYTPEHRTLEEFDRLYIRVGVLDYSWYQSAFEIRANPLLEEQGFSFVRKVRRIFPSSTDQLPPEKVLQKLEQVAPGFIEWAQIFERPEPTREEVKATLKRYYKALETEDLSLISFTPNVLLGLPGGTTVEGEEDVRLFLANTAKLVVDIEVLRTVIEGEYACSMTNYRWTGDETTPLGICFRVIGDRIAEIHPYFDPRPILED